MHIKERIAILVQSIGSLLIHQGWMVSVAESCTGGGIMQALTSVSGSSAWVDSGLVTYSNDAKQHLLAVDENILMTFGAVSDACALAMIAGIRPNKVNLLRIATTGIAGPLGGSLEKPVGTVFLASQAPYKSPRVQHLNFLGTRKEIVQQTIFYALREIVLASLYESHDDLHCFYALMLEDVDLQQACHDYGLDCGLSLPHLEPKCNLHVTLAYLGKTESQKLHEWIELGDRASLQNPSFILTLTSIYYWEKVCSYVLEVKEETGGLVSLSSQLGEVFVTPHLTLSKRHREPAFHQPKAPLSLTWKVSGFSLMSSFKGVFYQELKKWPLLKGVNHE